MDLETILFEVKAGIALVTLNRPEKMNSLNRTLLDDLSTAFGRIENDESVSVVIITGSGSKAFAAGADVRELHECDKVTGETFSWFGQNLFSRIESMKIPVIAAVNGFALGGGCELALACHIRYASKSAHFGQPEINLGIIPGYGGTQRLPKIIGFPAATEMILTGCMIDAQTALSIGLVNKVFDPELLLPKTFELANNLSQKSLPAIKAAMESMEFGRNNSLDEGLAFESGLFGSLCGTSDFKEGTCAFLEKRRAQFKGK